MAFFQRLNTNAESIIDTGFGSNTEIQGGRFINKDGKPNVKKSGIGFFEGISWYHTLLSLTRIQFLLIIFLFYFLVNIFFAFIYYYIGVEHLNGIDATKELDKFSQAFFFSIQTFTTVGYGHINPEGFITSTIAAVEALTGLLSFALATGLFYGRFSKPKAYIIFSENALISPYQDKTALMFRLAPNKNTHLTDLEVKVTLALQVIENGETKNKFYNLDLEVDKISALNLSWTIVHPIDDKSPLWGYKENEFKNQNGEVIVFLKAFDDMFSSNVIKRTSYIFNEIIYGAKFNLMFSKNEKSRLTNLHMDKLNSFENKNLDN